MSDVIDRALNEVETGLAEALRQRKPNGPKAVGFCLWCGEETPDNLRWCNTDCRDTWEHEAKQKKLLHYKKKY